MPEFTENDYRELKQDVENAKAEADRAAGALDQLLTRLKDEFECKDLKQAKTMLAELKVMREKAERAFNRSMEEYEKKWKGEEEE